MEPTITIQNTHISIADELGEIVYWDRQEWIDDPEVTPAIANAIHLALTHGMSELRRRLIKGNKSNG